MEEKTSLDKKRRQIIKLIEKWDKSKWKDWNETKASKSCYQYFESDVSTSIQSCLKELKDEMKIGGENLLTKKFYEEISKINKETLDRVFSKHFGKLMEEE